MVAVDGSGFGRIAAGVADEWPPALRAVALKQTPVKLGNSESHDKDVIYTASASRLAITLALPLSIGHAAHRVIHCK